MVHKSVVSRLIYDRTFDLENEQWVQAYELVSNFFEHYRQ